MKLQTQRDKEVYAYAVKKTREDMIKIIDIEFLKFMNDEVGDIGFKDVIFNIKKQIKEGKE